MADEQNPQLPLGGGNGSDGVNGAGGPTGASSIIPINIEDEMRRSYLDYSMSVIIGRALPDVRDGFKPVHRRILYTLHEMGLQHNKKYTKCAKVVGQAMGVFHPHGDSAIYDTLVRLAQPFSLRYPMVDGQGNFGSVDGDPPAAMRYTECRMEKIAGEMLADIDMETVDFVPNYDESTMEPTVLPTRIPNLIVNGSNGIAVGMATNIPPHNLTEVINAAIELINNPQAGLLEVLKHMQGPDFPTGGFLYGRGGIAQAYKTGRGRFLIRAKVAIENLTKEKQAIIVSEIPYQVNKMKLVERIAELAAEKIIDDIAGEPRDESDRDGMRIVIELKRGAEAADRAESALQAHATAGKLLHDLSRRRERPAERAAAARGDPGLPRTSRGCGAAADGLPAAQGARAGTHPQRLQDCAGQSGCGHPDHSRIEQPRAKRARTCIALLVARATDIVIKLDKDTTNLNDRSRGSDLPSD